MATNTQISREDLIFQICTGPQAGQSIPVNTRKCLLQDQAQGDCAVAVFRGPQGVSARALRGEATLNGNAFDAAWLSNGDRLCFGEYELEVTQTGWFGEEEPSPESFENSIAAPAYAEYSGEFEASSVGNTSSELEAAQAFEYSDNTSNGYGYAGAEAGSHESASGGDTSNGSDPENGYQFDSPSQTNSAFDHGDTTEPAAAEIAAPETAASGQFVEQQQNYSQESAEYSMQESADFATQDYTNEGTGNNFADGDDANAFNLTPEQTSWHSTEAGEEAAGCDSGFDAEKYEPEQYNEAPKGEPTIHDWNATSTEQSGDMQSIEPASMDPWNGKFTAMETSFEELRDQQAAIENRFDSLQEQLEMLTGSVAQLMETLTTSSFTPQSDGQGYYEEETAPEGSFETDQNWPDDSGQLDAQSLESAIQTDESADPMFDSGNEALHAGDDSETSSEFSARFSRLFSQPEESSTADPSTTEERYEAIAEIDQEEVFEVEQTGTATPQEGDEVRDRLNDMFSSLESQTSNELAFDSGHEEEQIAQSYDEASATSLENILQTSAETTASEGHLVEAESEAAEQNNETPANEESESVAAVLARMQAKGTLPETSFGDNDETSGEAQSPFSATPEPAPGYQPEQPVPAAGGNEDSDSSVQDYMNQLLGRLGNGPSDTSGGGSASSSPATTSSAPQAKPGATPVKLLSPDEYKPSRQAPEKSANLDAMRELANMQAEAALSHSDNTKRQKAIILTSGSLTGLALAGGCYMLTLSTGLTSIPFICSVVAFGFAAFCGYRTWTSFQKITGGMRSKTPKAAKPAEAAPLQPEADAVELTVDSQIPAPSQNAPSATQEMLQKAIARAQQEAHEAQ